MTANIQVKSCLFCGRVLHPTRDTRSGKTDEHIIARWLMTHLGIPRLEIRPIRVHTLSRHIIDVRQHRLESLVAGPVCGKCNNGWMSQLEHLAKPILIRLIADPHRLTELAPEERTIVARWTLKTAAALNRASTHGRPGDNAAQPIPDEHLRQVDRGSVPEDVIVAGGGYAFQKQLDWLQFATWAIPANSIPLSTTDRERSYKIALGIRELMLAVAFYPSPEYLYGAVEGCHVPLWEGRRGLNLIDDPIDMSLTGAISPSMEHFVRNIFLVSKTWLALASNVSTTRLISAP